MAGKGLNCTPLPIFLEAQTHHQSHRGGSLSQPVPSQPTFQVLGVLAHHLGLPRHRVHLPITRAWPSSLLRCLLRAKATLEAEGIPEAVMLVSRIHTNAFQLIESLCSWHFSADMQVRTP